MKPFSSIHLFALLGLATATSLAHAQEPATPKVTASPCNGQVVVAKKNNFVCVKPGVDWSNYTRVALSSVEVAPTNLKKPLKEREVEKLKSAMTIGLEKQFGATAGDDKGKALRLKAQVTEVKRANVVLNVITLAAVQIPVSFGGASTHFELSDAQSGELLAEITMRGRGRIYEVIPSVQALGHTQKVLRREPKQISRTSPRFAGDSAPSKRLRFSRPAVRNK
jgi:hypothetical protein